MSHPLRVLGKILLVFLALILVLSGFVFWRSEQQLHQRYPLAAETVLAIPSDSAAVARGEHLFLATAACAHCHGVDAAGGRESTPNPVFIMSPPNLTRGRGGVGGSMSATDWDRAIRHGLRRDSSSLMVMPSDVYQHLSDADFADLVAYLNQLPPVDHAPTPTAVGPIGRALLVAGKLEVQIAPRVVGHTPVAQPGTDLIEQGRYLAEISGCPACHNPNLSGGHVRGEPPEMPPARNITPAGIGSWSEADFVRAIREGKRPDGTTLNPFMPWERYQGMTDEETHALWTYVRSVPAKE